MQQNEIMGIEIDSFFLLLSINLYGQNFVRRVDHTVAIWTFTFHKKSGFVMVILKANFKQFYRPKV